MHTELLISVFGLFLITWTLPFLVYFILVYALQ